MSESPSQLLLDMRLNEHFSFDEFVIGSNSQLLEHLRQLPPQRDQFELIYIWGAATVGKSHLAQACCQVDGRQGIYLPCDMLLSADVALLQGLETMDLICLDNVQLCMGNAAWEEALFHLYNRCQQQNTVWVVTSDVPPAELSTLLPDLKSRLSHGLTYHLNPLNDEEKLEALQAKAKLRGIALTEEVGRFILSRGPREMGKLMAMFDQLDQASLIQKRKLTIPFVKETFNW